jgi:hypothetical protein
VFILLLYCSAKSLLPSPVLMLSIELTIVNLGKNGPNALVWIDISTGRSLGNLEVK